MHLINGYYCINCRDELLAKQGIDPAQAGAKTDLESLQAQRQPELGMNIPESSGELGRRLILFA